MDNTIAKLVQAGSHDQSPTDHLQPDLANGRLDHTVDAVPDHHPPKGKQSTAMPELPNNQPD